MVMDYWQQQSADKALYDELLWSRPENKRHAGKALIVGGNLHAFGAVGESYTKVEAAGIGTTRVLLPDALQKTVGRVLENGEFAPSTPSGSFSQKALATMLEHAAWSDAVLLAGDFGRNSETAILLEKFTDKYSGPLIITKDAADYAIGFSKHLAERPDTVLVVSIAQLQKLGTALSFVPAFTFSMDLSQLVQALHEFTERYPWHIIVKHHDQLVVASESFVSTTKLTDDKEVWRVATSAYAAVWWLQNPTKPYEALTTAIHQVSS